MNIREILSKIISGCGIWDNDKQDYVPLGNYRIDNAEAELNENFIILPKEMVRQTKVLMHEGNKWKVEGNEKGTIYFIPESEVK